MKSKPTEKRDPCSACGKNPPFNERGEWRLLRLHRPVSYWGGAADEGLKLMCGTCLLPLRDAWLSQIREKIDGTR